MKSLGLNRYALAIGAAAALLGGCGGSQPSLGAPGAMPRNPAIATHADRGKSWMLPEAKSEGLLYIADACGGLCISTYPAGKLVGADPISWSLSVLRRKTPSWPRNAPIPWSSGLRLSS
jgi:hypothetical protein